MNDFVQNILGAGIITFTNIYVWSRLLNKKVSIKNLKNFIIFVLMGLATVINYFYNNQFLKILTITVFMSIFLKILFKEKTNKAVLCVVTSQMLFMLSEFLFVCGLVYIAKVDPEDFVSMYSGKFITNLIISLILIFIMQLKFANKIYNMLVKITEKIKFKLMVILLFILMIAANVYAGVMYYSFNFMYIMIFNVSLTFLYFLIIMNSFNTQNRYIKVYDKYNTTLNSLKEYEDILDKYRISNHENKNQLLTIRNMIPKANQEVISYIDQIVENKLKDNDKIMFEVTKIPAGGLRGLIYSKLLLMNELQIKYELNISKDIKTVDLINIDDSLMLDICKVIGVYIDNSIHAVKDLKKKYLSISLSIEDNELIIMISNNYKGYIPIDKIEISGYTTKTDGHGYGLTLAKQIIESNPKLVNEKKISKEVFTQILKVKM